MSVYLYYAKVSEFIMCVGRISFKRKQESIVCIC